MFTFPPSIAQLIRQFASLPGIGQKTAERLAFHLLNRGTASMEEFADALKSAAAAMCYCGICHNFSESDPCPLCSNPQRNTGSICVVADPHDQAAIEATKEFRGVYHILGGAISPAEGITAKQLHIDSLIGRIAKNNITEVILALNPDMTGETTILYLKDALAPLGVAVTVLARGLPMGADLEYADEITLSHALKNRKSIILQKT